MYNKKKSKITCITSHEIETEKQNKKTKQAYSNEINRKKKEKIEEKTTN